MDALTTLLPVFIMIFLGLLSRIRGWITPEQKAGANNIVFNILFPVLIFNVLFTSTIESSAIFIVGYLFVVYILFMIIGKYFNKISKDKYSQFSHYLLTTVEGGNVALPLYTSIVGAAYASNTVIFDLAGTIIAFIVIPVLVAKESSQQTSVKELVIKIVSNSFVIAVILGLSLNLLGVYEWLQGSQFIDMYSNTLSTIISPITGMILFIIGYDLKVDSKKIKSLLKLISLRVILYSFIILGFFMLFPALMAEKTFMIAVLLYFMCPTGFALPMIISPLYKDEDDSSFSSAYISLYMIITLIVYVCIVVLL